MRQISRCRFTEKEREGDNSNDTRVRLAFRLSVRFIHIHTKVLKYKHINRGLNSPQTPPLQTWRTSSELWRGFMRFVHCIENGWPKWMMVWHSVCLSVCVGIPRVRFDASRWIMDYVDLHIECLLACIREWVRVCARLTHPIIEQRSAPHTFRITEWHTYYALSSCLYIVQHDNVCML